MNPILTLTRFDRAHFKNLWTDACKYDMADPDDTGTYTMANYMADCIKAHTWGTNEPRYWSFAHYTAKRHDKAAISCSTAIVLEYCRSRMASVMAEMADLGFAHWIVDTETKTENRFAVIIPQADPILNNKTSNQYARVASVLLKQINVPGAVEGCIAPTFLVRPIGNARVQGFPGTVLDATKFISDTAEVRAKARDFINAGDDDADAGDDLFVWGK